MSGKDYERGHAVLSIFKRGAEFTKQILTEISKVAKTIDLANNVRKSICHITDPCFVRARAWRRRAFMTSALCLASDP